MLKRWFFVLIVLCVPAVVVFAQSYPQVVQDALDDLNHRLGTSLTLDDLNWRWSQQVYDDSSLGCPRPGQTYTKGQVMGYQVELDYNHITWDYRVSGDRKTLILCSPQPTATPTQRPTRLPPTLIPATAAPSATATPSGCPDSPPSRLVVGEQGRVVPNGFPNNVREQPGSSSQYLGEIPPGGVFYVLDGPRCGSGIAWWYVAGTNSDLTGWTPEGQGADYWLEPVTLPGTPTRTLVANPAFATNTLPAPTTTPPAPTLTATPTRPAVVTSSVPVVCAQGMPGRLIVGQYGQVTPGVPNNVREQPGTSSKYLGEIPPGGLFKVLDGPRCASGMAWWRVDYNGLIGWTPEGQAGDYWLEPVIGEG